MLGVLTARHDDAPGHVVAGHRHGGATLAARDHIVAAEWRLLVTPSPRRGDAMTLGNGGSPRHTRVGGRSHGHDDVVGSHHSPIRLGDPAARDPAAEPLTTASASTSTTQRGSSRPATTTIVLAGRTSPNTSPCTDPTVSAKSGLTTYIRVRTTSRALAPTSPSAARTTSQHRRAWAAGSG